MVRKVCLGWMLCLCATGLALWGGEPARAVAFRLLEPSAGATRSVAGQQVQVGHLTLLMDQGKATKILAGGQEVGLYFQGEARLRYLSTDALERGLFYKNAKTLLKSEPKTVEGGLLLEQKLGRFLIWTRNVPVDVQGAEDATPQETFTKDLKSIEKLYRTEYIHRYAVQECNAPSKPFAFGFLFRPGADAPQLVYDYDSSTSFLERLHYLRLPRMNEVPYTQPTLLSRTPMGWSFRKPVGPAFQLTHVDLDVTAAGGNALDVKADETLVPRMEGERAFSLNLLSHRFYYSKNGSWPELTQKVLKLEDGDGRPVPYLLRDDILTLVLPKALPKDQPFVFRCHVQGNILLPEMGDDNWRLDPGTYFPSPETCTPAASYTVHAKVRTRAPWVPVAGGDTLLRKREGDFNVLECRVDKPIGFYTIFGADYTLRERVLDGRTIRLAMYGMESQNAEQLINLTFGIIKFYEYVLGPFPFKEYTIVQDNSYGYGQAPAGLMVITNEAFGVAGNDWDRLLRSYFSNGINQRFAHEIAHQYWAYLAKWPNQEEQWLSESFAQFCSALAMNVVKTRLKASYDTTLEKAANQAKRYNKDISIPMANYFSYGEDETWTYMAMRLGLIYQKGALILASLRKQVGDDALVRVLRAMLYADPWGTRSTDEFISLLNQATGKDWNPFFERCYYGTDMP